MANGVDFDVDDLSQVEGLWRDSFGGDKRTLSTQQMCEMFERHGASDQIVCVAPATPRGESEGGRGAASGS